MPRMPACSLSGQTNFDLPDRTSSAANRLPLTIKFRRTTPSKCSASGNWSVVQTVWPVSASSAKMFGVSAGATITRPSWYRHGDGSRSKCSGSSRTGVKWLIGTPIVAMQPTDVAVVRIECGDQAEIRVEIDAIADERQQVVRDFVARPPASVSAAPIDVRHSWLPLAASKQAT